MASICLSLSSIEPSIGTENPIPEEMDYREVAIRVAVMNEVQLLFPPEPCKPLKPRSLYVVLFIEKDVRVERRRTCEYLNYEEIERQYQEGARSYQKHWNEEEWCIVAFLAKVRPRDEMVLGIVAVMEIDVVAKELAADWVMAELVMHQRLPKRHDQMRGGGGHEI
jgi:hypothetical protein